MNEKQDIRDAWRAVRASGATGSEPYQQTGDALCDAYSALQTKFEETARDRDEWADAIRTVAPGYIPSAHAAKHAIAEMKAKWDAAKERVEALEAFQAAVAYELGAERNPDLALDALKARLEELKKLSQTAVAAKSAVNKPTCVVRDAERLHVGHCQTCREYAATGDANHHVRVMFCSVCQTEMLVTCPPGCKRSSP